MVDSILSEFSLDLAQDAVSVRGSSDPRILPPKVEMPCVKDILKPLTGPLVTFLIGLSINLTNFRSEWVSGLLMGVAFFWGLLALLSNRALLDRYPRVLEWMPFLRLTAEPLMARAPFTERYISGKHIRIADLVENGMIRDRTIENCHLYGPAILLGVAGLNVVTESIFDGGPHSLLELAPDQVGVVGAIAMDGCTIRRCHLHQIGVIGPHDQIAAFRRDMAMAEDARQVVRGQ